MLEPQKETNPLPCPFCGRAPSDNHDPLSRRVACHTAGCAISFYGCTIDQWNTRTSWQPIETAPKDARILCVMSDRVQIAQWDDDRYAKKPRPFWRTYGSLGKNNERHCQPTVWMPLPEPPKIKLGRIKAPFTEEQVKHLREWQRNDQVHPFTCCNHRTMEVSTEGFICPACGVVQTWCHDFMAEPIPKSPLKD